MPTKNKGFTLIEILVTVAIIALLATIAIPNILRARVDANDAMAQNTLKTISTAMETYAGMESRYPPDTTSLLSASPQYILKDYFSGVHSGFTYTADTLTQTTYSVTAVPVSANLGSSSFTISTGGVLVEN